MFVNWFRSSCDFQDWEDSHGESKKILQQVLLPHEIVANFLAIGEVHRMIGREVPCQNGCFAILAFSNDMFAIDISWYPIHVNVFNVGLPKDLKKFWELESRATWYQQHPILSETCCQFLFCEGANPTFNCGASHHASVIENTSAWNPPRIHEQICRAAYRCVSTEMALNHSVTWKSHMKLLDIQFLTSICQF